VYIDTELEHFQGARPAIVQALRWDSRKFRSESNRTYCPTSFKDVRGRDGATIRTTWELESLMGRNGEPSSTIR